MCLAAYTSVPTAEGVKLDLPSAFVGSCKSADAAADNTLPNFTIIKLMLVEIGFTLYSTILLLFLIYTGFNYYRIEEKFKTHPQVIVFLLPFIINVNMPPFSSSPLNFCSTVSTPSSQLSSPALSSTFWAGKSSPFAYLGSPALLRLANPR